MQDCIFCKIIEGEIPSEKVYEDDIALAFLDINPVNTGHTLIVPKKHFENIYDLPEEISAHIMKIAKKISIALKNLGLDGINIIVNNGAAAGQIVPHFHTHVIPRLNGDNLPPWPARRPKQKEIKETAQKIIQAL